MTKVRNTAGSGMNKWTSAVHEYSLRTKLGVTPSDALSLFGPPPTTLSIAAILAAATRDGWFRRAELEDADDGLSRRRMRTHFVAVDKANQPSVKVDNRTSWFQGITRVRSVFELGDS